jgi:hypothetical protein
VIRPSGIETLLAGQIRTAGFQDAIAKAIQSSGAVATFLSLLPETEDFEPEGRTESGLILPCRAQTLMFGGFEIDLDRAFITFVLSGLLLGVIMSPVLAPIGEHLSWALWLVPVMVQKAVDRVGVEGVSRGLRRWPATGDGAADQFLDCGDNGAGSSSEAWTRTKLLRSIDSVAPGSPTRISRLPSAAAIPASKIGFSAGCLVSTTSTRSAASIADLALSTTSLPSDATSEDMKASTPAPRRASRRGRNAVSYGADTKTRALCVLLVINEVSPSSRTRAPSPQ